MKSTRQNKSVATTQPRRQTASLNRLAQRIKQEHKAVEQTTRQSLIHARRAGQLLNKAKAQLDHGEFMKWRGRHCGFSHASALLYMKIADNWSTLMAKLAELTKAAKSDPVNSEHVPNLTLRGAVELLREKPRAWGTPGSSDDEAGSKPQVVASLLKDFQRFEDSLERNGQMMDRLRLHADHLRERVQDVRAKLDRFEADLTKPEIRAA